MPDTAPLENHLEALRSQAPQLAEGWVDACLHRLRDPGKGVVNEDESRRLVPLSLFLQPRREAFSQALSAQLQAAVDIAQGRAERSVASRPSLSTLDEFAALTLVDEAQAERDIDMSRIVQWVELKAEWELRELRRLLAGASSTLQLARRPSLHPGDPAVIARAFAETAQALDMPTPLRGVWMRIAGAALAEVLKPQYTQWAEQLKEAGARSLSYAMQRGPVSSPPAPSVEMSQVASALPGRDALSHLFDRSPAPNRPSAAVSARPESSEKVLLARLFQQILIDTRLAEPVRLAIGRLEGAVGRMAAQDPSMLSNESHPTWTLINQLAAHAAERPQGNDARTTDFLDFVEPMVERLAAAETPAPSAYTEALAEVQSFIARDGAQQIEQSAPALEAFNQAERERDLQPLLAEHVKQQLAKSSSVSPNLRHFLEGPWSEVLARTMAREGDDSPASHRRVALVNELIDSVQPRKSSQERQLLRQRLPALISQVQDGMALIDLPLPHRERVLAELMQEHRRLLLPTDARPAPAPAAPAAPETPGSDAIAEPVVPSPPSPPQIFWDDDPLEEEPSDQWRASGLSDTNLGSLPTVPMGLGELSVAEAASLWLRQLPLGVRCKVFLQGQWATARLIWRSDTGQFYMFSSPLAGGKHSMTRRAIERLRVEGLITDMAEPSLLQRAARDVLDSEF